MVGDCCWLARSLEDLQFLFDMLCFETLMMQTSIGDVTCSKERKRIDIMEGVCDFSLFLSHISLSLLNYE
jgi:hypothetical protein